MKYYHPFYNNYRIHHAPTFPLLNPLIFCKDLRELQVPLRNFNTGGSIPYPAQNSGGIPNF